MNTQCVASKLTAPKRINWPMMKSKILLFLLLCLIYPLSPLRAQESKNQFIPESAFALIDIDVEQIKSQFINSDGKFVSDYFPAEVVTTMGETYLGFDYMTIRKVRIVIAEGENSLDDIRMGLVYEFDKAVDIKAKFNDENVTYEIGDIPVHMDMDFGLECMQLNETTVLHATPDFMRELSKAKNVSTPLTALLDASTAKGSEILGVFSFDQIKEDYSKVVSERPIPEPLGFLNGAHRLLNTAEFRVADHMMTLEMSSDNEKTAAKLRLISKRLVGLGKASALESVEGMLGGMEGDPVSASMVAYFERVIETIATELAPVQDGNQVTMKLKTDAAWFSLVIPMMFGFF